MDGPGDGHAGWGGLDRKRQISWDVAYRWNLKKNDTDEFVCRAGTDSENQFITKGGRWGEG